MKRVTDEAVFSRLTEDSPWWAHPNLAGVSIQSTWRRDYFSRFFRLLSQTQLGLRRALVLIGPRRVGKTVLMKQAIAQLIAEGVDPATILYAPVDTPTYSELVIEDYLDILARRSKRPKSSRLFLFLDEIQYHADWERHVKSLVDAYPQLSIVVSGSSAAALKRKSSESGAGRLTNFDLPPLTFHEFLKFREKADVLVKAQSTSDSELPTYSVANGKIDELNKEFESYLHFGGFPEAVMSPIIRDEPERFLKEDIIDKVLIRDLPSLYGISNTTELYRLFKTLAFNTAQEASLEGMSQQSGIVKETIQKYFEFLEAAFLVRRIKRVDERASAFKRERTFKVYLTNPSIYCGLFGSRDLPGEVVGRLAETAIFSHWFHGQYHDLRYARWKSGEVDLVDVAGENSRARWAMEIKWSDRPQRHLDELDNLVEFGETNNIVDLTCTTLTATGMVSHRSKRVRLVPTSLWCYTLAANTALRLSQL
ncbi:MAG: ATP-binding protein [Rhodospirillaceae bacterium]|nr:ATP-binding protein [Rhodospirillaceae bacterium]